jgi:hypothetical protein
MCDPQWTRIGVPRQGRLNSQLNERTMKKALTSRKRAASWIALIVTIAACDSKGPQQPTKDQALTMKLAEIAGQANRAAPATVDADTRLDGARAGPGLKLTSMYTLVNPEANGIDGTTFETKLAPVAKEASCGNSDLRPLIDQGVVVVLEYRGMQGNPIGTIRIDRATCTTALK